MRLLITRLDPSLPLPSYARPGDAGLDLHAREPLTLAPGRRSLVPTGVAVAVPPGWVGLVHPRSGLAARHGVTVLNAPGTVDSGYRGEILVNLVNLDPEHAFRVEKGDRIAQLLLQEVGHAQLDEVDVLPESVRGDTGHGSTGGLASSTGARGSAERVDDASTLHDPDRASTDARSTARQTH